MRNAKGFLLFEVMVSMVIVTTGLLYIVCAYSSCKNSVLASTATLRSSLLAEEAIWPFVEKDGVAEGVAEGCFENAPGYSWRMVSSRIENSGLNTVRIGVLKADRPAETLFEVTTYLKNKR